MQSSSKGTEKRSSLMFLLETETIFRSASFVAGHHHKWSSATLSLLLLFIWAEPPYICTLRFTSIDTNVYICAENSHRHETIKAIGRTTYNNIKAFVFLLSFRDPAVWPSIYSTAPKSATVAATRSAMGPGAGNDGDSVRQARKGRTLVRTKLLIVIVISAAATADDDDNSSV